MASLHQGCARPSAASGLELILEACRRADAQPPRFDEHLNRLWPQAINEQTPLALLLIDIDHFKAYNGYYDHQADDQCLKQVAWCLSSCGRRPLDLSARYGNEEFALVSLRCAPRSRRDGSAQVGTIS